MGTYLCFSISNSITQKKWEKIYEETLVLADKLNLANWDKFYYKGVRAYAYCKVKEHSEEESGEESHFWVSCGEYTYLRGGEYFSLGREIDKNKYDKNAGPAILCELDSYSNITPCPLKKQIGIRELKTSGGLYHSKLLAVLCFLESKLKEKIYIYGDIDKGQCENAVRIANKYLEEPIDLPARCDYTRLYEIIKTIDIPDEKKLNLMVETCLGEPSLKYKKFIEEKFDNKVIDQFWKKRFKDYAIGSYKFNEILEEYLSYGFAFKKIFLYITYTNIKEESLKFLESIIYIENNKNLFSKNIGITRNPENNTVRGFSLEFRCSLFEPENKIKIENCTFDDYVNELSKYFGEQVDVRSFLKEKIKDEDDDAFVLRLKEYCGKDNYYIFKGEEKYDIILSRDLMYYKTGDKIAPFLMKAIKEAVKSNKKRLLDKKFKELQKKDPTEQIYELIDINHNFPARDIDWFHAIDYFNSHSDALKRYYPLFNMESNYFSLSEDIAKALFMNDEFYEFYTEL